MNIAIGEATKSFELKVDEILADKVATLALERISEEEIEEAVKFTVGRFSDVERNYWSGNLTKFDKLVMESFLNKIGSKVQEIMDNEDFEQRSTEIAERIIKNSRTVAEKHLTESIAKHMCLLYSDFNREDQKYQIQTLVHEIFHNNGHNY